MNSNLSDHFPNIDCQMHKISSINLMVTTNQKPAIGMKKIKRKPRISLKKAIKLQEKREGVEKRKKP